MARLLFPCPVIILQRSFQNDPLRDNEPLLTSASQPDSTEFWFKASYRLWCPESRVWGICESGGPSTALSSLASFSKMRCRARKSFPQELGKRPVLSYGSCFLLPLRTRYLSMQAFWREFQKCPGPHSHTHPQHLPRALP